MSTHNIGFYGEIRNKKNIITFQLKKVLLMSTHNIYVFVEK